MECVSCKKKTVKSVIFPCPKCKNKILRCEKCRSLSCEYKCPKCSYEGP